MANSGRTRLSKNDMVSIIASKTEIKKTDVDSVLTCFFSTVIAELSKDHTVTINGFGRFENANYKSREVTSPFTGKTTALNDRVIPRFKAAKGMKERVKKKVSNMNTGRST